MRTLRIATLSALCLAALAGTAASFTGFGLIIKVPTDSDGDGVPDGQDQCNDSTSVKLGIKIDPSDGCPQSVIPDVCRGDYAPPKLLTGSIGGVTYAWGATVDVHEVNDHTAFGFEMSGDLAAEIQDDCPEVNAYVWVFLRRGSGTKLAAMCPALTTVTGSVVNGRSVVQATIDKRNPCKIELGDDEEWAFFSETSVLPQLSVLLVLTDGAGNMRRAGLGNFTMDMDHTNPYSPFTLRKSSTAAATQTYPIPKTQYCPDLPGWGCSATDPSIALAASLMATTSLPAAAAGSTVIVSRPTITVYQYITTTFPAGATGIQRSAVLTRFSAGEAELLDPGEPGQCSVSWVSGTQYRAICTVRPDTLTYVAGSGVQLRGVIQLRASAVVGAIGRRETAAAAVVTKSL